MFREKEGENFNVWLPLTRPQLGDLAHNPGTCSDWESNQPPFGSLASAQSTESHQLGLRYFMVWTKALWEIDFYSPVWSWSLCSASPSQRPLLYQSANDVVLEIQLSSAVIESSSLNTWCQVFTDFPFTGYQSSNSDSLFWLEQGGPRWIAEEAAHSPACPEEVWESDHTQRHPENQSEIKTLERCQQSYALGNNFNLYKSLVSLTARHIKFGSHYKNLKSRLGFVNQKRTYARKDSDEFIGYGKPSLYIPHDKTCTEIKYYGCVKPSSTKSQLSDHQKTYPGEKPHECIECGKVFTRKAQLIRHQKTERGEKPHGCSECGKTFMRKIQLIEHQRTHTGERPHECKECGKAFARKSQLMVHQRTHTGEKPYVCSECGKAFSRKCLVSRHQRSHTGEKLYGCSVCRKAFSQKAYLIAHQRLHTGEKPYKCSECERTFFFKSDLTKHQRIHTGEKPYECSQCEKAFRSKSKLIQHQRTHSGERPYACTECGKAFAHMSVLIKHKKTHTREKAANSLMVEKASSGSHSSLYMSELLQEQNSMNTVPVEMSSATQTLLSIGELIGNRNVIVKQPFPRSQALVDNQEFAQGTSLANAVSVTTPSVINYVFCVTDIV
ncbi:zinc finger protein 577 [Phyllostomus discolor]|uniref:Zinc finger protein 577 n=1 Tax=Phyllostomus discolor TaxID=89673 RepID=A0A834DGP8_9CHIR|nr:zinc finger protein 577 [Phyllostomus discolor]